MSESVGDVFRSKPLGEVLEEWLLALEKNTPMPQSFLRDVKPLEAFRRSLEGGVDLNNIEELVPAIAVIEDYSVTGVGNGLLGSTIAISASMREFKTPMRHGI